MAARKSVSVTVLGREYRIRADRDEDVVRQAAELVDETMQRVKARAGTVDTVDVAVLAALNIARQFVTGSGATAGADRGVGSSTRVEELITLLERAVDPAPTAH